MPFYRLTVRATGATMDVRANRPSCARGAAARDPAPESPRVWRDPELSSVEQIPAKDYRAGYHCPTGREVN